MTENKDNIEVLYHSLSEDSQEQILLYTKLIAAGEANARKAATAPEKGEVANATAR